VAEPNNDRLIASALTTPLFALSAQQLFEVQHDEAQWSDFYRLFQELHHSWLQYGFMTMFRQLLAKKCGTTALTR
jgi:exodeoxyribonuclease V beta subunit